MLNVQITVAEVVNSVDYESVSYMSRYARNTCVHVPIRITLVAYLSAITIINYNQLAPMYTPKFQLNKHRSDRNASNSKLRNY